MPAESKIFSSHRKDKYVDDLREGFEVIDPHFDKFLPKDPKIIHHWRGAEWAEGVVYLPRQKLVVMSDVPNNRMISFDPVIVAYIESNNILWLTQESHKMLLLSM